MGGEGPGLKPTFSSWYLPPRLFTSWQPPGHSIIGWLHLCTTQQNGRLATGETESACSSSSQARPLAKPPVVSGGAPGRNVLPLSKSPILGPAGPSARSLRATSVPSGGTGASVTGARRVGPGSGCARQGEGRTPGGAQVKATSKGRELGRAQREAARGTRMPLPFLAPRVRPSPRLPHLQSPGRRKHPSRSAGCPGRRAE